ncbi:MAG TPA: hypothetical protein VMB51_06855 [Solirubrobacteraceae bacterium]|nr:hypothetical protein [Solirubrobacteraceae bacterium]
MLSASIRSGTAAIHVAERMHVELTMTAWRIASELGWAKAYDAEYLAIARLLDTRVVTLDMRLRRGADRLGLVVTPSELIHDTTPEQTPGPDEPAHPLG